MWGLLDLTSKFKILNPSHLPPFSRGTWRWEAFAGQAAACCAHFRRHPQVCCMLRSLFLMSRYLSIYCLFALALFPSACLGWSLFTRTGTDGACTPLAPHSHTLVGTASHREHASDLFCSCLHRRPLSSSRNHCRGLLRLQVGTTDELRGRRATSKLELRLLLSP